jgi:predicted tellurium resistance membrane protein TerC
LDWITDPQAWIALLTLTVLEIVLGVDNVIFISILSSRLPEAQRARARTLGLALALVGRVALLVSLSWVIGLKHPLFSLFHQDFSGRDLIMLGGGLFLLAKATHEIHGSMEGGGEGRAARSASFASVIAQILVLDLVFSLDSVITAVGMADDVPVMIAAVVIAVLFMMASAGAISTFIHKHPTVKMLALAFLLLVGVALIADGFGQHIPRGYVYFAMAFSVFVEVLNLRASRRGTPPDQGPDRGDGERGESAPGPGPIQDPVPADEHRPGGTSPAPGAG